MLAVKQQKKNDENNINLNASPNSRTVNNLHQVETMLLELDLRMLQASCTFSRKLSVVRNDLETLLFGNRLKN